MVDKSTNGENETETVDAASLGKGSNSVSRATLAMIAGTIILVIIAAVVIGRIFSQPTGTSNSGSTNTTSPSNR